MMRLAIVGARSRQDRQTIIDFVAALPLDTVVISGGCRGVDTWAVAAAAERGMVTKVYPPDLAGVRGYGEAAARYHARNGQIVAAADAVIAFIDGPTGGTWDTIRRARRAGKPVTLLPPVPATPRQDKKHPGRESP